MVFETRTTFTHLCGVNFLREADEAMLGSHFLNHVTSSEAGGVGNASLVYGSSHVPVTLVVGERTNGLVDRQFMEVR